MPPQKNPDDAERRQSELAQKSESMARELSQKRELRIRQDRVRHLAEDPPGALRPVRHTPSPLPPEDRTLPAEPKRPAQEPSWETRPGLLDEVAGEIEELLRDLRQGWRVWHTADKITLLSALATLVGTLLPWVSDRAHPFQIGLVSGGVLHAGLAVAAIALLVQRAQGRTDALGQRVSGRELSRRARRTSLWHLLLGALSTLLCAYLLVVYGLQRNATTQLEVRFGLYVTLAAGMGLSYGGFSRFWSRHE